MLSYQTGSQELKIEVELQQIGEQSLENQYNSTLRLESNKWKLFFSKRNIMGKNNASWEEEWRGKEEDIAYFFLLFATVVLPWWKAFCARENDASSAAAAALQGPWLQELGMQHEMLLSQK